MWKLCNFERDRETLPLDHLMEQHQDKGYFGTKRIATRSHAKPRRDGLVQFLMNGLRMQLLLSLWPYISPTTTEYYVIFEVFLVEYSSNILYTKK